MTSYKSCCLLVSGWLGNSGKTPYRTDDEGRGPDYVLTLLWKLEELGVKIVTNKSDVLQSNLPYFELHLEVQIPRLKGCPRFLVLLEDKHIRPQNYFLNMISYDKVFTWDPDIAKNLDCHLYTFPSYFTKPPIGDFDDRMEFLTLISANKGQTIATKYDLYAERRKVIAWYEKNYQEVFSHYGPGWDLPDHPNGLASKVVFKLLKKLNYKTRNRRPNWRGIAESKLSLLRKSKFNLCFENYCGARGYVTEKIFDAFSCGSIPIYWGAENILEFVPEDCFIDYRKFKDVTSMHEYISTMRKEEYTNMQENISEFYNKSRHKFSIKNFAEDVCYEILNLGKEVEKNKKYE